MKKSNTFKSISLIFYIPDLSTHLPLPLQASFIPAGFPSPADDFLDTQLDLNELVKNPAATFFARVKGNSMQDVGIHEGDILIVDRSREVRDNHIAICVINGEFTVKRVSMHGNAITLKPENPAHKPLSIQEQHDFFVWGRVVYVIHQPE